MWRSFCFAFFLILSGSSSSLLGQFYTTGEAPASLRWNKLQSPHFRLVFPEELATDAATLVRRLEQFRLLTAEDTLFSGKPFPVLLHNTSVLSNGYVTLAPRRMEVVMVPPQDGYAQDWITQLTLHEYRHVVQLTRMNQGFTRVLSWFTGEIGPGSVSSMLPSWFHEGDAVFNETRLSATGRGRVAGFEMPLRTLLLAGTPTYSYDKATFGSYRDYVPDPYQYGYQVVSFARSRFGPGLWPGAINYTARNPYLLWPLAFYLKRHIGVYKSGLYDQTMDSLKAKYYRQEDTITYSNYTSSYPAHNRLYTRYTLPRDPGTGKVLALKKSLDDPGSFVLIDTAGRERRLIRTGYTSGLTVDLHGGRLVWDEVSPDPRWERRDYSILKTLDLTTGKQQVLTRKTRYFSPDFSPAGERIAVVETDLRNRHFLTLLDAATGDSLQRIAAPENRALQFPRFISDSMLVAVTVAMQGKQLEQINLANGQWKVILPFTRYDLSEPLNYKQYILFRSSFKGIENVYAVDRFHPGNLYQVTFSRFGAYHPSISADSTGLLFSNYGLKGYEITRIPLDTTAWQPVFSTGTPVSQWGFTPDYSMESTVADTVPEITPVATKYRKSSDLFHVHSWTPFYYELENYTGPVGDIPVNLGFMLFTQNLLSTAISSIGYRYQEGYHEFIPVFTWRGWYPVIELRGKFNGPVNEFSLRSYVPLLFTKGRYINGIQPQAEYAYSGITYSLDDQDRTGLQYLHYKLYLNHYRRLSSRDLFPRWGQTLTAAFTHTPFEQGAFGSLFSVQAGFFFPGMAPHHHLYGQLGMQWQHPGQYFLPQNQIRFPRGYTDAVSRAFTGLYLNYAFPVAYPDWSLGPVLYLKRFRVNVFNDLGYGTDVREQTSSGIRSYTGRSWSYGTELLADMHVIRIIFPVSAGIRIGFLPEKGEFFSEFMFSMQTGGF